MPPGSQPPAIATGITAARCLAASARRRGFAAACIRVLLPGVLCSDCLSAPTHSSRIEAETVSSAPYQSLSCAQLQQAFDPLKASAQRQADAQDAVVAKDQDYRFWTSPVHFPDSVAAQQLGHTRGQMNAILSVGERKHCDTH